MGFFGPDKKHKKSVSSQLNKIKKAAQKIKQKIALKQAKDELEKLKGKL